MELFRLWKHQFKDTETYVVLFKVFTGAYMILIFTFAVITGSPGWPCKYGAAWMEHLSSIIFFRNKLDGTCSSISDLDKVPVKNP